MAKCHPVALQVHWTKTINLKKQFELIDKERMKNKQLLIFDQVGKQIA